MLKPGTYIDYHVKPYLCTKFGDSSLKNEFRNAKRGLLIKWSIMRIFNEAENYGRESVNGDFPCAKLENAKKKSPKTRLWKKTELILITILSPIFVPN